MYKKFTHIFCTPQGYTHKFWRVMKLTTIILIAMIMQVSAATFAQRVTYQNKHATIEEIFQQIRKQTGYNVLVSANKIQNAPQKEVSFKETPLQEVMIEALDGLPLTFEIQDKTVLIKDKELSLIDKAKAFFAQVTITGKVQDETGQPMIGVSVTIKSTSKGTATDAKGNYTITVPDDKTIIIFSFVGYETQQFTAKDLQSGSTITLKASTTNLKEIVVSKGYYTTTQELNTGNVVRISGEDLAKQPVSDPIIALEGRVAGLFITQSSGIPGSNPVVQLRGKNSIAQGNDPLYIVDGVPFSSQSLTNTTNGGGVIGDGTSPGTGMSPFNILDPSNIESIEILKDADATAIYGSRGANGVILITTKHGKPGKTVVNFDLSQGAGQTASKLDLMNTQQYLAMRRQALKNDGLLPGASDYDLNGTYDQNRYTDWQKVFTGGTAQYTNLQGSLSGGTANLQFNLGGGYRRETTVFPGNYNDQKGTAHINLIYRSPDQKFQTNFSAQYANDNSLLPSSNSFDSAILLAPNAPALYNPDGTINWQYNSSGSATFFNPVASTLMSSQATTSNLIGNLQVNYEVLPGLKIKTSLGYTKGQMIQSNQQYAGVNPGPPNAFTRSNSIATTNNQTWIFEPQISYSGIILKGKLDLLVGMTEQQNQYNSIAYTSNGFSSDALVANPSFGSNFSLNGTFDVSEYHYAAVYGRVGYDWLDKYLLNLTARRDGSSRFGPGNQFGNFGAVGAGWIFSKEKFATGIPWLSFGKLRASYGVTGSDQIGNYRYLSAYSAYRANYQGIGTIYPTNIANPTFRWESNQKLEGGLDLGMLNDRIYLSIDYFRNRSGNQLVTYNLPLSSGFNNIITNLPAVVQNTGLEVQLNSTNVNTKAFKWTSSFNITVPGNKLVSYPDLALSTYAPTFIVGQSILLKRLYHYTGVDPQTGLYTLQDFNGDGVLNNADKVPVLTSPKYYGGFDNSFTFQNFELDIFLQFTKQLGQNYLVTFPNPGRYNSAISNLPTAFQNAWQQTGDHTAYGRYSSLSGIAIGNTDAGFSDASFIRLKTVQLSYQLPFAWRQKMHMQNFRLFLQGQNLLTLTKYQGLDPENQNVTGLPPLRMFAAGINLRF